MKENTTSIHTYRQLYHRMNNNPQLSHAPMTLSLVEKEGLEDNQTYIFIKDKLNAFSRKINKGIIPDTYETRIYEKLFQLMFDLNNISDKELQNTHVEEVKLWLQEQERIIKSRVKQGMERTIVNKESRKITSLFDKIYKEKLQYHSKSKNKQTQAETYQESMVPYLKKWRTIHNDAELPSVRLNYYERKKLNPSPQPSAPISSKYSILHEKVSYPQYHFSPQKNDEEGKQTLTQIDQSQPEIQNQNQVVEEVVQLNDIPMFGEQPEEGDNEKNEENQNDDLIPSVKLYFAETKIADTLSPGSRPNEYIKPPPSIEQTRLELKFKLKRDNEILQKNLDEQIIALSHRRAKQKSSANREMQKRSEISKSNMKYSIMKEPLSQQFKLSNDLEKKYHLSQTKTERKLNNMDLSLHLPKLDRTRKNVRNPSNNPSLNKLKKRFSQILNLSREHEPQQEESISIAQYSSREYSTIQQDYTKKICRLRQLEEVESIRERLNHKKININIQTLVNGLCQPNQKQIDLEALPQKSLLHNEFMVETKKKKK